MDALDRLETNTVLHGSSADYQRDHGSHANMMGNDNIGSASAASMIQLPQVKGEYWDRLGTSIPQEPHTDEKGICIGNKIAKALESMRKRTVQGETYNSLGSRMQ